MLVNEILRWLRRRPAPGLRERLVLAALDALRTGDPTLVIGVNDQEVRISWFDNDKDLAVVPGPNGGGR